MNIGVIGSGVYAKALAKKFITSGNNVTMWSELEDYSSLDVYDGINVTNSYEEAVLDKDLIYILINSKYIIDVLNNIKMYYKGCLVVIGSKGILSDGTSLVDITKSILNTNSVAVISGPTFAMDISNMDPIGFTVASNDAFEYNLISKSFNGVKLEYTNDIIGTELCGTLKNVYAIGSGIISGLSYGYSTTCLYLNNVINEISNILSILGNKNTINNLCGFGDLILTATSNNSRNFSYGNILASNNKNKIDDYFSKNTIEGYENLLAYYKLFKDKGIDTPILNTIYDIIINNKEPKELINIIL